MKTAPVQINNYLRIAKSLLIVATGQWDYLVHGYKLSFFESTNEFLTKIKLLLKKI